MENELPKRKRTRLENFDYNLPGAYFVTVCTENKRKILSQIVGGDVLDAPFSRTPIYINLSPYGKIAEKYINQLNDFYDNISIESYVIMPNHIHILLFVKNTEINGASRTSPPTAVVKQHSVVPQFVSTFKRFCNKEYGKNIWQRSFHDHVIRNHDDYLEHQKYILDNPMRWQFDELYIK